MNLVVITKALYLFGLIFMPAMFALELQSHLSLASMSIVLIACYLPYALLAIPFFISKNVKAPILFCFLILLYLTIDITRMANGFLLTAALSTVFDLAVFIIAMFAARQKTNKA